MHSDEHHALISEIASRKYKARELAERHDLTVAILREFVEGNRPAIEAEARRAEQPESEPSELTPTNLADLWISNKLERLRRLQAVADSTYAAIIRDRDMTPADRATVIREFRSYLMLAANELGQLLHRGSGENSTDATLSVSIEGVDMEALR